MTKTKEKKAKPADIPPFFRKVMEERKHVYGVSFQFTLRKALAFAVERRHEWDDFFCK